MKYSHTLMPFYLSEDSDPLQLWNLNYMILPRLSALALHRIVVAAGSTVGEYIF